MEIYTVENLSFAYPDSGKKALLDVNFSVNTGEFVVLCGRSGCGKTTLLRLLKPSIAPFGNVGGRILFSGRELSSLNAREQAQDIGFVMQSPDNQIVTDKVWHELAFGLESLGCASAEIRARVAEMAAFFGIQEWFHKSTGELSGGQKQLLNLASVMVMQPKVLILDEPTSQLDPIAAQEFLNTLKKINTELGTTVILSEHRLEEAAALADRLIVIDDGRIIADAPPRKAAQILAEKNHEMYSALPTPMIVYGAVENGESYPINVREGRSWLEEYAHENGVDVSVIPKPELYSEPENAAIELRNVWFRYDKKSSDVIKGLNMKVRKGEIFAVLGGNGTGKTTTLSLICGLLRPYRGDVLINGQKLAEVKDPYSKLLGVLPQNPQTLFVKSTVLQDLLDAAPHGEEGRRLVGQTAELCGIADLLSSHPYDLSGGEQQRAALAKILLKSPEILILDEPTKGMDVHFKRIFAQILKSLSNAGATIVMVSHDIEFCAEYADSCAMFFDGGTTAVDTPRRFFAGKNFYTTAANRMARAVMPAAVLTEDIVKACGKSLNKFSKPTDFGEGPYKCTEPHDAKRNASFELNKDAAQKISPKRKIFGLLFGIVFVISCIFAAVLDEDWQKYVCGFAAVIGFAGSVLCLFEQRDISVSVAVRRKLTKRTALAAILILVIIPLTIYIGLRYMGGRKYYFISIMIIMETLIPFCMIFEQRKPQARELVVISVLCAAAVAGREAFFMLPQFKPMAAVVIISGVCLGSETGFLVGAVSGFVSNTFFGQGPWTPWQMFALGIIGFAAGVLFGGGFVSKTKLSLCVFGAVTVFFIYGGIMNPASVLMQQENPNMEMILSAYAMGVPFDAIHALSTAFFLWVISAPMIEKLERVKVKYGLIER